MASDPTAVTTLYEQTPLQAMQQVYESYMAWYVDRVTSELDKTIAGLRAELRENDTKEASFCPSPNEQAAIERMKRSGVTGQDLLDRMVEQGEDWLVLTMRRLDHFERTGLAPKDYSTWCEHALSGAYDWIDHERLGSTPAAGGQRATGGAQGAPVPEWLGSRGGQRQEEGPTAPVPSVGARWSEGGHYGPGQGGQGSQPSRPEESDGKGRNIFRIFTN